MSWTKISDRMPGRVGDYIVFVPEDKERPARAFFVQYDPEKGFWISPEFGYRMPHQWENWITHWAEPPSQLGENTG